jgi:hypothetical protein
MDNGLKRVRCIAERYDRRVADCLAVARHSSLRRRLRAFEPMVRTRFSSALPVPRRGRACSIPVRQSIP